MPHSFPPVVGDNPKILVLGTAPSPASLSARLHYGHPQNAFWPIMAALFNVELPAGREERYEMLKQGGVALWDVLFSCDREGAADANIKNPVPNDIEGLLAQYPGIGHVFLNGGQALKLYSRFFPKIVVPHTGLCSTSPAYARPLSQKVENWSLILSWL